MYPTGKLMGEGCAAIPRTALETFKCKCVKTWFIFTAEPWNFFQEIPACLYVLALQVTGMLRDSWAIVAGSYLWGSLKQAASPVGCDFLFFILFCFVRCTIPWPNAFHLVSKWLFLTLRPTRWLRSKASCSVQYVSCFVVFFFLLFQMCVSSRTITAIWRQVLWMALVLSSSSAGQAATEDPRFPSHGSWWLVPLWSWARWQVTIELFYSLAALASISDETTTKVVASVYCLQDTVIQHRSSLETASGNEGPKWKLPRPPYSPPSWCCQYLSSTWLNLESLGWFKVLPLCWSQHLVVYLLSEDDQDRES